MTRRRLNLTIAAAAIYLLSYLAVASWAKHLDSDVYKLLTDFVAIAVALPAALLAGAFQRRISYLQALREYWKQLIPAIQGVLQYTYRQSATQDDYSPVYVHVSSVIDITRSVFVNIPAAQTPSGLYPYENLKDILTVLKWVGFNQAFRGDADRRRARQCVTNLWQEMYLALLREFDRAVPVEPVSKYLHTGCSIADLLKSGALAENHLHNPLRASNPIY